VTDTTARPLTAKGKRTRDLIVAAAAELMVERGAAAVSIDDVCGVTHTSKSQMYHYFASRDQLVTAVLEYVGDGILAFQSSLLRGMETLGDVERWADAIVASQRSNKAFSGCPLGTLASELSGDPQHPQPQIEEAFATWRQLLEEGLGRMAANGQLKADVNPHHLAVATLAALQGGLLMAKATQDESSLRIPLDAAIDYLRHQVAG